MLLLPPFLQLGILVIAIIKDIDGYELCLVSSEIFDQAILEADDFKGACSNRPVLAPVLVLPLNPPVLVFPRA